jgi:uroporphyrinogen-III synthase
MLQIAPVSPLVSDMGAMPDAPLAGRRVVTTREAPGTLDDRLASLGATVQHLAMIATVDVVSNIDVTNAAWVVVTSPNGARRAGPWVQSNATKLAAVGDATAGVLAGIAGRSVDLVPERASAADLCAVLPAPASTDERLVVVRGELADDVVVEAARSIGWQVDDVVVYATTLLEPATDEVATAATADVVLLASGSAAQAWANAVARAGVSSPPVIAMGPPTRDIALSLGLEVRGVAKPPGVDGLIDATLQAFGRA